MILIQESKMEISANIRPLYLQCFQRRLYVRLQSDVSSDLFADCSCSFHEEYSVKCQSVCRLQWIKLKMKSWIISLFYLGKIKGKLKKNEVKIKMKIKKRKRKLLNKWVHRFLFSYQFEIQLNSFFFVFLPINYFRDDN
jgi:hypothetical protein